MPRYGIEFPPPYGRNLPFPSDYSEDEDRRNVTEKLYDLWLSLFDRKTSFEQQVEEVDQFFDKEVKDGIGLWLEDIDPKWKKRRVVLIKEKALQAHQRIVHGVRTK